jgi:hypothetical protein
MIPQSAEISGRTMATFRELGWFRPQHQIRNTAE